MSRVVGIDVRDNHVRVAALNVGYRKLELGGLYEAHLASYSSTSEALRACLAELPPGGVDTVVAAVDGTRCFLHTVKLPESAKKRINELLPFELEAVLPLELDELLTDHEIVGIDGGPEGVSTLSVLSVATRPAHVQAVLDLVREASDRQAERVGCSTTELGQLAHLNPVLRGAESIALVDLGFSRTDICIIKDGALKQARALSMGIDGFPEQATAYVARLRQTLTSYATASGQEVARLYVMGDGASMSGVTDYLAAQLGVPVEILDTLEVVGLTSEYKEKVPAYARALGMAMHGVRGKGLDLRKGDLTFERGYEHVKARAPLFAGLLVAVLLSFFFSIWAESRALESEHEALIVSLEEITRATFGTGTSDPDEAQLELEKARKSRPDDPMPYLDGFGVAVALAETLPDDIVHDAEELDVAKGKVTLRGLVDSTEDAQTVAKKLGEHRCIVEPSVTKITQVVNSEKERYTLEAGVHCPEDRGPGKGAKKKVADK